MKTIHKFTLTPAAKQAVMMPKGAVILCAQSQDRFLCLWALVDQHAALQERIIEVFGTGRPIEPGARTYISTVQLGAFVWHIFERTV